MYVLMISYVSREKAMAEGLAFWTDDGIPGIQVSPLPLSILTFPLPPSCLPRLFPDRIPGRTGRADKRFRRNIGIHSPLVRIEIRSESLPTLYTLVVCF
jgi:hypothetical protein